MWGESKEMPIWKYTGKIGIIYIIYIYFICNKKFGYFILNEKNYVKNQTKLILFSVQTGKPN